MGDGVLVYFGYPQAHEDDAERAVRGGLELVAAVSALKTHAALQTRVGIATGLVVVGDLIGSGASQEQAIVGETPNRSRPTAPQPPSEVHDGALGGFGRLDDVDLDLRPLVDEQLGTAYGRLAAPSTEVASMPFLTLTAANGVPALIDYAISTFALSESQRPQDLSRPLPQ